MRRRHQAAINWPLDRLSICLSHRAQNARVDFCHRFFADCVVPTCEIILENYLLLLLRRDASDVDEPYNRKVRAFGDYILGAWRRDNLYAMHTHEIPPERRRGICAWDFSCYLIGFSINIILVEWCVEIHVNVCVYQRIIEMYLIN